MTNLQFGLLVAIIIVNYICTLVVILSTRNAIVTMITDAINERQ